MPPPAIVAPPSRLNPLLFWMRGAFIPAHGVAKRDRLTEPAKRFLPAVLKIAVATLRISVIFNIPPAKAGKGNNGL